MAKHQPGAVFTSCPQCGQDIWDNRQKIETGVFSKKGPHFSCRDKDNCKWASWPDANQGGRLSVDTQQTPATVPANAPSIVERFTPPPKPVSTPQELKKWYEDTRALALELWGRSWMNDNPDAFVATIKLLSDKGHYMGTVFPDYEGVPAGLQGEPDDLPF